MRKRDVWSSFHFENVSCYTPVWLPVCIFLEFYHVYEASACRKHLNRVNVTLKHCQVVSFESLLLHRDRLNKDEWLAIKVDCWLRTIRAANDDDVRGDLNTELATF
jgi:hypothetical protein